MAAVALTQLVGHHKGKVQEHPTVENAAKGAVCPVVGAGRK